MNTSEGNMGLVTTESFMTADRDRWHISAVDGMVIVEVCPEQYEPRRLSPAEAVQLADFLRAAADGYSVDPAQRRVEFIDYLSQCIRVIDGDHTAGAGLLAERLVDCLTERGVLM